jgi:RNA 2',3'-cyclic 3'-phosphodiesterase
MRAFIAIELPEDVKNGLRDLESSLKTSNPASAKWVDPCSIHLTLKFLGNTRLDLIPTITSELDSICKNTPSFSLAITELGAFPDARRVQVVWVGLTGDLSDLNRIQKRVEAAISPLGYPTEKRPFVPHLTLARVRDSASFLDRQNLGSLISRSRINASLKLRVDSVSLIQSRLTPEGAIHTKLYSAKLTPYCA